MTFSSEPGYEPAEKSPELRAIEEVARDAAGINISYQKLLEIEDRLMAMQQSAQAADKTLSALLWITGATLAVLIWRAW